MFSFNSLFEIRANPKDPPRKIRESFQFSFWDSAGSGSIRMSWCANWLSILFLRFRRIHRCLCWWCGFGCPFNSLFEIRKSSVKPLRKRKTFNSLFEIPMRDRHQPYNNLIVTFNSLFEILETLEKQYPNGLGAFSFNSLFEIRIYPRKRCRWNMRRLSILFLRFFRRD